MDLELAHFLAKAYAEAVDQLAEHWPGPDGTCLACPGERYPCPAEHLTERAITGIEARWRREARRP